MYVRRIQYGYVVLQQYSFYKIIEKRQLCVRPIEWLKLNFASCVVHQTRSLDVLIPYHTRYFIYNMVFVSDEMFLLLMLSLTNVTEGRSRVFYILSTCR